MKLREATPDDAPLLADAWHAMLDQAGLLAPSADPRWREYVVIEFRQAIALGAHVWIIAEADGVPAGTGAAFFRGGRAALALTGLIATLAGVYTFPEFRRRGIARAVVARLLEICRERKCVSVRLRASKDGRHLYESLGFTAGDEMVLALSS